MKVREDKAGRTVSIELAGENFVTFHAKGPDSAVTDIMAALFGDWVEKNLDKSIAAVVERIERDRAKP